MTKRFRACSLNQPLLLPQSLHHWLSGNHVAHFIADTTSELDLRSLKDGASRAIVRACNAQAVVDGATLRASGTAQLVDELVTDLVYGDDVFGA